MCQFCNLRAIVERDRWPNPLEPQVAEFKSYIPTAHKAATDYQSLPRRGGTDEQLATSEDAKNKAYDALEDCVQILNLSIDAMEDARSAWWNEPAKKEVRRRLLEEGDTIRLGRMNAVNNKCVQMIGDVRAGVGRFVRWVMGVDGAAERLGSG